MSSAAARPAREAMEKFRHQCEVRMLIAAQSDVARDGEAWVAAYLANPRVAGRTAALSADMQDQIDNGNDGREGLWL